jgi:galacturonosyltransferase
MKILILSNNGVGFYKFRKELVDELIGKGHKVYCSLPNDDYVSLIKNIGCEYIETYVDRRGTNPLSDIMLLLSYIKVINKIKPDIVLTYTIKPNVYGGIACRITNTPYLPNITGLGTAIENKGLIKKLALYLYKIGLRDAKCVFFQNDSNKQFFIDNKIVKMNYKLLPGSGVNIEEHCFEKYPEDDKTIKFLFAGRIMRDKGIDELIKSAIMISECYQNIEFHIVGFCEEEYLDELNSLSSLGVIHYHGYQEDIHKFMKMCHAIILPSYHEGMSNVLLEAASTGRPILASKIPGCMETFEEEVSGFGFEVRNVNSTFEVIKNFIELPYYKKKKMGKAGRLKMEKEYDRELIIETYFELIENRRRI